MKTTNAIELLRQDHDEVRSLVERFAQAQRSEEKRNFALRTFAELEIHAAIEEKIFYPALAASADGEAQRLVVEAIREHGEVKNAVAELKTLALGDAEFAARFDSLASAVEHHAAEEEQEMFPKAEQALGAELERLGAGMMALKQELRAAKPFLAAA